MEKVLLERHRVFGGGWGVKGGEGQALSMDKDDYEKRMCERGNRPSCPP